MRKLLLNQRSPAAGNNGFAMSGYYVWGGTIAHISEEWIMLASRWPQSAAKAGNKNELDGYRTSSEIVRARSNAPEGPYTFDQTVLGKRDDSYWDGGMTHNPYLMNITGNYYLFYIGSKPGDPTRRIGISAGNADLTVFERPECETALTIDANNPAPYLLRDGRIALMFRDRDLHVFIAIADSPAGPFDIVAEDVFPDTKLEDFCIYPVNDGYVMICEDNVGLVTGHVRWGAAFHSEDGIRNWEPYPIPAYNHSINFENGQHLTLKRRERPQLVFSPSGDISHLVTSSLTDRESRCMVIPVEPSF